VSESGTSPAEAETTETEDFSGWFVEFSDGLRRSIPPRMIRLKDLETTVEEAKNRRVDGDVDLFSSVYRFQGDDPNLGPLIGGLVFDLDDARDPERARKEAVELVRSLRNEFGVREGSIDLCYSGSKGFSLVINRRVFGFEPSEILPLVHKSMAGEMAERLGLSTVDPKIYERRRLWRLPNSRNSKSMLYKVRLTVQELESQSIEQIRQIALRPRSLVQRVNHELSEQAHALYLKHKAEIEASLATRRETFGPADFSGAILPCIAAILDGGVEEGYRNTSAFCLAVFFARSGESMDRIKERLLDWNQRNRPPLDDREIEGVTESAFRGVAEDRYSVGCSNVILAEHCDIAKCAIVRGGSIPPPLREKAEELLRDPEILQKILKASERQLTKDEDLRTLEILVMASVFGPSPLNLNLSQVWSSGRTAISVAMADLLPEGNAWLLGGLSPTALTHERGEWDEKERAFVVNLDKKLLVFLENPDPKTLQKLRPLLSHDRREIMYRYTDRTPKGSLRTMTSVLRGWPGVIFCGLQMPATEEYSSRWITASPDVTKDKIGAVIDRSGQEMKTPKQFEKGEEFDVVRAGFQILGEGERWKVVAKFGDLVSKYFRKKYPTDMRRFKQFRDLIFAVTTLHAFRRNKDEDGNLIAELKDIEIANGLLGLIETTSVHGVGRHLLDYHRALKDLKEEKGIPSISYDQATIAYRRLRERPISKEGLLKGWLKPLEEAGLIDFEEDPEDKRRKNIVILEGGEEPLFDFEGFMKEAKMREQLERKMEGE